MTKNRIRIAGVIPISEPIKAQRPSWNKGPEKGAEEFVLM